MNLTGPIDGQRAHDIINAYVYVLAILDRHVFGRPTRLLDGPPAQYSEVLFESRLP